MPKRKSSGSATVEIVPTQTEAIQLGFDYSQLDEGRREKLKECTRGIYESYRITLEAILHLGQYFYEAKQILSNKKQYLSWIEAEFTSGPLGISHDTANNWLQVYQTWKENPEARDAMDNLSLRTLYKVCKDKVDIEIRDKIFQMAREGSRPTIEDVKALQELTRTYHLSQSAVVPEAKQLLLESDVSENPEELKRLASLPKKHQPGVAGLLAEGKVETVRAAMRMIVEQKFEEEEIIEGEFEEDEDRAEDEETSPEEMVVKRYSGGWMSALKKVPSESIDLLVVECPLKFDWVSSEDGLGKLTSLAERVLVPGGFMVATVGHKAIMYSAEFINPLVPLHVLTLRKMPGNTRSIVGINIMAASTLCVLAYKPPFRPPERMLVDLQTYGEAPLPGLDEVPSGIERGFDQIIRSLVCRGETVGHLLVDPKAQFNIRDSLKLSATTAAASLFFSIG